ncbi:MAG: hypothetical protein OXC57_00390 [Rhodobacteraceae bacterium]|nr:hypothetical protein [Paracoccaceae bacterium]
MTSTADDHHVIGPLGSNFWKLELPPELVSALAREFDWNRMGKRVMIDAREGITIWMTPSSLHVDPATAGDKVIPSAAAILQMIIREKRDNRWQGLGDPQNVGLEADAVYYIRGKCRRLVCCQA